MLRVWPVMAIAVSGACFAAIAVAEPLEAEEEAAMIEGAGALTAPEELEDPGTLEKLAFINTFGQRVKGGDAVADMMWPTFFFVYAEQHE